MRRLSIVIILLAVSSACARRQPVQVRGPAVVATAPEVAVVAEGRASYYGDPYHGRKTASGETFDKNKMTAAHRTLPFDTWVRVENLENGKTVDVRINDRGPFVSGRVIDLSEGAARKVAMIRSGVVPVRMGVIKGSSRPLDPNRRVPEDTFYVVQLGAFQSQEAAQRLGRRFESKYIGIYVDPPTAATPFYTVRIGRSLLSEARYIQGLLKREDDLDAIVVQMH